MYMESSGNPENGSQPDCRSTDPRLAVGVFVNHQLRDRPKQSLEILTGRVETTQRGGHAFAVVRNLEDGQARQRVQAILRRCGRGPDTRIRILSDGEDDLRGVVGWFGKQCEHRLDWFHVSTISVAGSAGTRGFSISRQGSWSMRPPTTSVPFRVVA
jgi:hypothetical protein